MNLLIISHSACHPRQLWFYQEVAKHFNHVGIIAPKRWGKLSLQDYTEDNLYAKSCPVNNAGNLANFQFLAVENVIKLFPFKPDMVLVQQEWWSKATLCLIPTIDKLKTSNILFTWENIRKPSATEQQTIKYFDSIIVGNKDAYNICQDITSKINLLPQVGVDTQIFRPIYTTKIYDLIFTGRPVIEKGIDLIEQAANQLNLELKIVANQDYASIPAELAIAKIFISLPKTTPSWKEQCGGYAALEAMACGLPVITTDSGAVPEYLQNYAVIIPEKELTLDRICQEIQILINSETLRRDFSRGGRALVETFYSNEVIAKKLANILKRTI